MSQTMQSIHSLSMQLNQAASLRGSSQLDELDPQMTLGSSGYGQDAGGSFSDGGKFTTSNKFSRLFGKKASRVKEILLQNLGKADRTTDELFQMYEENFYRQQSQALKLQKEFKSYVNALKGTQEAGKSLSTCIKQSTGDYQSARHDLVCENLSQLEHLNEDLLEKLRAQVLVSVSEYLSQFNELRAKIAKRRRKLIDFDSSRRVYELMLAQVNKRRQQQASGAHAAGGASGAARNFRSALALAGGGDSAGAGGCQPDLVDANGAHMQPMVQSAASQLVDEARLLKLREQYNYCKIMYETINGELYEELPMVYEKKMKNLLMTLQNYFSLEAQFHSNAGKLFATASDVIDELPMSIQSLEHNHNHRNHHHDLQHQQQLQIHGNHHLTHLSQGHTHEENIDVGGGGDGDGDGGEVHYAKTIASESSGMGSSSSGGGDSSHESSSSLNDGNSGNGSPTGDDGDQVVITPGDEEEPEEEQEEEEAEAEEAGEHVGMHAVDSALDDGPQLVEPEEEEEDDDDGAELEEEAQVVDHICPNKSRTIGGPEEQAMPEMLETSVGQTMMDELEGMQGRRDAAGIGCSQSLAVYRTVDDGTPMMTMTMMEDDESSSGQIGELEKGENTEFMVDGGESSSLVVSEMVSQVVPNEELQLCEPNLINDDQNDQGDNNNLASNACGAQASSREDTITSSSSIITTTTTTAAQTPEIERKCLYKVKTSYKYLAEDVDELCFEADEIIQVIEFDESQEQEEGWLMGVREVNGQRGLFPANFTRPV